MSTTDTLNILILGADHGDIWYSDDKWKAQLDKTTDPVKRAQLLEKIETNKFTTKFMAQLSKAAGDSDDVSTFFDPSKPGVTRDKDGNLTVDPKKFRLN